VATNALKPGFGGNSHGACRGLDQAVRFINNKALIPRYSCENLGFYNEYG